MFSYLKYRSNGQVYRFLPNWYIFLVQENNSTPPSGLKRDDIARIGAERIYLKTDLGEVLEQC